ncbi:MAG: carboxypeptidase M32 [Clostridia bacterium]
MELDSLITHFRDVTTKSRAYSHAMAALYYDAQTVAPKNSVIGLSKTMGMLSELDYNLTVNKEMMDCIATLHEHIEELQDPVLKREVELKYKQINRMSKLSVEDVVEFSKLQAEAESVWEQAKNANDYSMFEPYLARIVETAIRFIKITDPDKDPYEAMLNDYEEGLKTEFLDQFFALIRDRIAVLLKKVQNSKTVIDDSFLKLNYPVEKQRELSDYLMKIMSINRDDCIIGEVEHPFTTSNNKHDVRITTHYHEDNMVSSMYSVIHEGGHALYELNTGDNLRDSFLASGTSMAAHESQSRFYENIIGRSKEFVELIFPKLKELFPEQLNGVTPYMFYLAINKTEPSLIRTEADELTYSLHIMIRYELEKRLIAGTLLVKDLPMEWNKMYKEYLGVDVPDFKHGVLQDSHWAGTLIGYFPSYAIGSAYSAQMLNTMQHNFNVFDEVKNNRLSRIVEFMTDKMYKHGMLLKACDVVETVCNEKFDPSYYIDYLEKKYTDIYNLKS